VFPNFFPRPPHTHARPHAHGEQKLAAILRTLAAAPRIFSFKRGIVLSLVATMSSSSATSPILERGSLGSGGPYKTPDPFLFCA
jgi:hypothetical protein